jgi:hypothetical protein
MMAALAREDAAACWFWVPCKELLQALSDTRLT